MAKEEAAPLSPAKKPLSPTKQRRDAEPRSPAVVFLRFACGALCFLGGVGCLVAAVPILLSASPDLEVAQIVRAQIMRATAHRPYIASHTSAPRPAL